MDNWSLNCSSDPDMKIAPFVKLTNGAFLCSPGEQIRNQE